MLHTYWIVLICTEFYSNGHLRLSTVSSDANHLLAFPPRPSPHWNEFE